MKKNWYKLLVIIILTGSVLFSCQKKREETPDPAADYQTAQDDMYAQQAAQQTFTSVNNYGINDEGIKSRPYYITIDNEGIGIYPKTMTIDFDAIIAADAALKKGRTGKITAVFSGPWRKHSLVPISNTSITITFANYKVKGVKYDGTLIITYLGTSATYGGPSFNFKTSDMKFTYTNGEYSTWVTDRTVDWAGGYNANTLTDTIPDLKFVVKTGSTNSGLNSKGASYTATVVNDMTFRYCPNMLPITTGTLDITQNGIKKTINFGDTDVCDNKFKITINGITVELDYAR